MDTPIQPSFIPRKPLSTSGSHTSGNWLGVLLVLVATLIFIASIVAAGGAFVYQKYINNAIATKSDMLKQTEAAFDPATIQELVRDDRRIINAQALLQKHTTALGVFNLLSQDTQQTIQYNSLTYDISDLGVAHISVTGVADSFATVALQSDKLGSEKYLKDVSFSGITASADGSISFTVKATVDPTLISYSKNLSTIPEQAPTPIPQSTTTAPIAPVIPHSIRTQ